jgi:hypothetical protein
VTTGKVVAGRKLPEQLVASRPYQEPLPRCLAFTRDGRRLATGLSDGTILLWDLPLSPPKPEPLAVKEIDALWSDLADADAGKAWRAVWRLADFPTETLPVLRQHLKAIEPAPAELTRGLLADLDGGSFERRQAALKQLREMGPRAEPALRQALQPNLSLEQRRRIEEVLKAIEGDGGALRDLRAVTVLDRIGSAEARRVLEELSKGVEAAALTRGARAALARLKE